MEHEKINNLPQEEVELLESLFRNNLRESPLDVRAYRKLAETDEDIKYALETMLESCLNYTEDVAKMERYLREHKGEYDDEREDVDKNRSRAHDATISSIDIFARVLKMKSQNTEWLKWEKENRAGYGNFAILLTLNRFKDDIIAKKLLEKIEEINRTDIDFDSLKKGANAVEIKIIKYVEILSEILKVEDENNLDQHSDEIRDIEQLKKIETELNKDEEDILSAFHQIYLRRYELE